MKIRDLGELQGRVLLFGGPYSNAHALAALVAEAAREGVPPANMICTGDVVAYCAEPAECVAMIRSLGCPVVAGNCELQLARGADDCGCGFDEGSVCSDLSRGWYAYADARIGAADRAWMAGLPERILFSHQGRRYVVIHGGARDVSAFIWPTSPDAVLRDEVAALAQAVGPVDGVICGHSGLAFIRETGRVRWINAGVIGMPENDGATDTRYILMQPEPQIRRLFYDARAARAAMEAAGLDQGYHRALTDGHWPSEDVLPQELRRRVPRVAG